MTHDINIVSSFRDSMKEMMKLVEISHEQTKLLSHAVDGILGSKARVLESMFT